MSTLHQGDLSRGRHNANSQIAFENLLPQLTEDEQKYLDCVIKFGERGTTNAEVASLMRRKTHAVSGRGTSLKLKGLIVDTGERRNFCGTWGGVIVAKEFSGDVKVVRP
jgi:hypothetical protein